MKTKTSITLSDDVLAGLERNRDGYSNRSEQINTYLRAYIKQIERVKRDAHDSFPITQREPLRFDQ